MTDLGIRQVDRDVVEAATAFGGGPWRILFGVELPLAAPTIMAGVNQTIMMALSMVVVASMIGARGLGERVLNGIQTLDVGKGLEAGIGIVILAVLLDRMTRAWASRRRERRVVGDMKFVIFSKSSAIGNGTRCKCAKAGARMKSKFVGLFGCFERCQLTSNRAGFCHHGAFGSGKSTLVRHLNRLIEPTSGEVLFDGRNILDLSPAALRSFRAHRVSMVFQASR